jgi:hypothetical protein
MRKALDVYLSDYAESKVDWHSNGYATGTVPLLGANYILVATNPCPFLTENDWGSYPASLRQSLLNAWNPNNHLQDFVARLGEDVDLWVVHGVDAAWPLFRSNPGTPLLFTGCLAGVSRAKLHLSKKYWTRKRPLREKHPAWVVNKV